MKQWIAHVIVLLPALTAMSGCGGAGEEAAAVGEHENLIATSATHACAVRKAGLYCWGQHIAGELGTNNTAGSDVPVLATVAGSDIAEVATNTGRTCVRRNSGEVACWGLNEQGQI